MDMANEQVLMRTVPWPSLGPREVGLSGLYSCGHWSSPCGESSSQWDFAHDVHICPTCGTEVQFDLRLQSLLVAQDNGEEVVIPHEDWSNVTLGDINAGDINA